MQRFNRAQTRRMLGLEERQLQYWERLRLIRPRIRWGERLYSFSDLIALRAIHDLVQARIPAWRLRRALHALELQTGGQPLSLDSLSLHASGREVAIASADCDASPVEPLTGQFVFAFASKAASNRIQCLPSRSVEEIFAEAFDLADDPQSAASAVALYLQALAIQPDWIEPRINLGVAYYHLGELDQAARAIEYALRLEPEHPIAHFNLGCVLAERGATLQVVRHFLHTIRCMPSHADAHFNLAAAYDKLGDSIRAHEHWRAYLRLNPSGEGAEYARAQLQERPSGIAPAPIPFISRLQT